MWQAEGLAEGLTVVMSWFHTSRSVTVLASSFATQT